MSTAEALEELEGSPEFLDHLARLNQVADDERRRREQFVEDLDEDTKAEFINGQVVVHSPARLGHTAAMLNIAFLLTFHARDHSLGIVTAEKTLIRCGRNVYEPDVCFFKHAKCADWDEDKLIFPPPDLVVEVLSPSTERNDRHAKLHDYARHAVGEYWIVDADERTVEQYVLPPGTREYELRGRLSGGDRLASVVLAGFNAQVGAFFDAKENQEALRDLSGRS